MFVTVTTGNYPGAVIALRPYEEDHAIAEPAQTLQALFAIMLALSSTVIIGASKTQATSAKSMP